MGLQTFDESVPFVALSQLTSSSGTGPISLFAFQPYQIRIDNLLVTSDDTVDHVVTVNLRQGSFDLPIGSATIPAGSGMAGTPSVDLLALVLPTTQVGIVVDGATSLSIQPAVAITALKTLTIASLGGLV